MLDTGHLTDAGDASDGSTHERDSQQRPLHVHAREPGRVGAESDRAHPQTGRRAGHHEPGDQDDDQRDHEP